ncbi:MAG: FHA domain-containing protein [Candidatus Hydrogenedentes bacterium]|nr:FHA domain-containing protein [Candidatus Hydrogenedentota bacterium]
MKFTIVEPGRPRRVYTAATGSLKIGRRQDGEVVLFDNQVSGRHAELICDDDRWEIRDLGSLNGTFVNGKRIVSKYVRPGDEIRLGMTRLIIDDIEVPHKRKTESSLEDDIDRIASEMEEVGNHLSMIGRKPGENRKQIASLQRIARPAGVTIAGPADSTRIADEVLVKTGQAYRRLQALYEACKVAVSNFDLMDRLEQIMDGVMKITEADRGFLMLRDEETGAMTACVTRAMSAEAEVGSPSMSIANRAAESGEPVLVVDAMADEQLRGSESIIIQHIKSAMCVPLKVENRILGSVYVDARRAGTAFNQEDLEIFSAVATQSAIVIENSRLYEKTIELETKRSHLQRYLSPSVVEEILNHPDEVELGGTKRQLTAMFCDIRGFTGLSEQIEADQVVALLNEYFSAMTEILFKHKGTLDKYIGDEIMGLFGSPITADDDAVRAVRAAVEMQDRLAEMRELWRRDGRPPIEVGIGLATGEAVAGNVGSPSCMGFTAIGNSVNTARRLCGRAEPNQIFICEKTYEKVASEVDAECLGPLALKGKAETIVTYLVHGLKRRPHPAQ